MAEILLEFMKYKLGAQVWHILPQFRIAQFSFGVQPSVIEKLNISIIFPQANIYFGITPFWTILPKQMNNFSCSQAKLVLYNNAPCWLLDQWSFLTIRHPFGTDNDRVSIVFGYWQSSFRSNLLLSGQWNDIWRISRMWRT